MPLVRCGSSDSGCDTCDRYGLVTILPVAFSRPHSAVLCGALVVELCRFSYSSDVPGTTGRAAKDGWTGLRALLPRTTRTLPRICLDTTLRLPTIPCRFRLPALAALRATLRAYVCYYAGSPRTARTLRTPPRAHARLRAAAHQFLRFCLRWLRALPLPLPAIAPPRRYTFSSAGVTFTGYICCRAVYAALLPRTHTATAVGPPHTTPPHTAHPTTPPATCRCPPPWLHPPPDYTTHPHYPTHRPRWVLPCPGPCCPTLSPHTLPPHHLPHHLPAAGRVERVLPATPYPAFTRLPHTTFIPSSRSAIYRFAPS